MEKKRFKLSPKDNKPFEVELQDRENGSHVLIRLSDGAFCDSLNLVFTNGEVSKDEVIEARTFHQLDLEHSTKFTLNGNYSDAKGFVEGDVYIGNWEEIVLNEVELSFSDAPFYIRCNSERIEFTVGAEGESKMDVESVERGFSVVSTLIHGPKEIVTVKRIFDETSDGAQIIKRLYGRMKGRVKGVGFEERQEGDKAKLTAQFNKTISESFRHAK